LRKISNALSLLRSIFVFDPLIYGYTFVLGSLSLLSSFFDRDGGIQHGFARIWSRLILATSFVPVRVTGLDPAAHTKAAVYAVNHASAFDIPVLYASLPFQFRILAKRELFRYPFMGWHLKRSGQIAVDADTRGANVRGVKQSVETLRSGMPLLIFPEGGRTRDGHLQPFLRGAFYAAIRAGVDIVPMALVGTWEVLPMNSYHIHPGPAELVIGERISTAGYTIREMDKLSAHVREVIADLYYARVALRRPEPGTSPELVPDSNTPPLG
jgi:1-acyl-sn-glycerol-3-phosphate acyltransferase